MSLSTDKDSYWPCEPVSVEISFTNTTETPQQYGPISALAGYLRFSITDPQGEQVSMFADPAELSTGWVQDESTALKPGQTQSRRIHLSYYYPVNVYPGTYTVEVGYPIRELVPTGRENAFKVQTVGYETQTIPINIAASENATRFQEVVQPFCEAVTKLRNRDYLDSTITEALERVLREPTVDYLAEQAMYYLAHHEMLLGGLEFNLGVFHGPEGRVYDLRERRPNQRAIGFYQAFLRRYPDSIFAEEAREGVKTAEYRIRTNREKGIGTN